MTKAMRDWVVTKRWKVDINEDVYEWHVLRVPKGWPHEIYEGADCPLRLPIIDVYVVRK